jgi:holo-[acyl-carrier protein] synthase
MLRTGVDLIEVARVEAALARHGDRFLQRCFTAQEQADCAGRPASLAARFAAKEAVAKALGCGIGAVSWLDIEIVSGPEREPQLRLLAAAQKRAEQLGLREWAISLSHTHEHAIAVAVAQGE